MNAPDRRLVDPATPALNSKLPNVGTTIFTVMSALAVEHKAINLGQGFPDFDCDARIVDAVDRAMRSGANQYPPMAGWAPLRQAIADKIDADYGRRYDVDREITVTAGATQALLTAILCAVGPGDEVVVVEPAYDSYLPAIALAGGTAVRVRMQPPANGASYRVDWPKVAAAVTPRTRMILVNSPHNPTGTTLRDDDFDALADIVEGTDVLVVSDEVYEHMVFDGHAHRSMSSHARLAPRAFVVSSFGKTFHVTGWKVGYCVAPASLMAEFRKVHQFNVFTVNTPMQAGIAEYLREHADAYRDLPEFYGAKRDRFAQGLARTRFKALPCAGTYFMLADYSAISDRSEEDFCRWLTQEIGVAAIPVSAFYERSAESPSVESGTVRFCFAKQDRTLDAALERLARA